MERNALIEALLIGAVVFLAILVPIKDRGLLIAFACIESIAITMMIFSYGLRQYSRAEAEILDETIERIKAQIRQHVEIIRGRN